RRTVAGYEGVGFLCLQRGNDEEQKDQPVNKPHSHLSHIIYAKSIWTGWLILKNAIRRGDCYGLITCAAEIVLADVPVCSKSRIFASVVSAMALRALRVKNA